MNLRKVRKGTLLSLIAISTVLVASCKKDSGGSDKPSSNALSLILKGPWRMTRYEVRLADSSWAQAALPGGLTAGDTFTFHSDGTYTWASDGVQVGTLGWGLYDNGQTVSLGSYSYHVAVLSSTTMQLVNTDETFNASVNGRGVRAYGERVTYSH
jgi:hypothetical protein